MATTQEIIDQALADITAMSDPVDGAIALMNTLSALVKANINDPSKLQAALAAFEAKKQALADAILANTPAAPAP